MATGLPARKASDPPTYEEVIQEFQQRIEDFKQATGQQLIDHLLQAIEETNMDLGPLSEPNPLPLEPPWDAASNRAPDDDPLFLTFLLLGMIFAFGVVAILLGKVFVNGLIASAIVLTYLKYKHQNDEKPKRKNDEKPKRRLVMGDDGELVEEPYIWNLTDEQRYQQFAPPEPTPAQYPPGGIQVYRASVLPLTPPPDPSVRKGIK